MKTPHKSSQWWHVHPGDQFNSMMPLHRLQSYADAMAAHGFRYEFDPSATGYWVRCVESPRPIVTHSEPTP